MGGCLDAEGCGYQNPDKVRFCARCGIPTRGSFLLGRYEIMDLLSRDRQTVTLQALDHHRGLPVMVRVLRPRETTEQEREEFLQEAELAMSLSSRVHEPGSIRVTDYGQDGPVAFLVKTEFDPARQPARQFRPHMTVRVGSNLLWSEAEATVQAAAEVKEEEEKGVAEDEVSTERY